MIYKKFFQVALLLFFLLEPLSAQDKVYNSSINGIVKNEYGNPLAGVVITSEFGKNIAVSGTDGSFFLLIDDQSNYVSLSKDGYLIEKVLTGTDIKADIRLKQDVYKRDEVLDFGYSSQLRKNVAGSVSTVTGTELGKSPVANLSSTFAGRFSGLTTIENSSEWARVSNSYWVRGASTDGAKAPIVIIDGFLVPVNPQECFEYITPAEIESVNILKDASLLALYGIKGANGAIVIRTKRGQKGSLKIDVHFDGSMQEVTVEPYRASSSVYAMLRNQAAYNDDPSKGKYQLFSEEMIAKFASGEDRQHYPNNDWYDEYFKKFAYMERVSLNLSGGSEKATFFSNINFMNQNTNFNLDENDKYDPTPNYLWANMRTNVNVTLNKYFKTFLNIAGNVKREKTTDYNMKDTYSGMFDLPPTIYGSTTPEILDPVTGEVLQEGGKVLTSSNLSSSDNVYGRLNRQGYIQHTVTNIYSNFGLEVDLSFLTKGLKINGSVGFQFNNVNSLSTKQNYERWIRVINDPSDWNTLTFEKKGTTEDTYLSYSKSTNIYYNLNYKGSLEYARNFGKHNITAMAYALYQDVMTGGTLPYKYIYSGAEAIYNYDQRYILTLDFGHSGSDQFAVGNRFHTTPAIAGAWVLTNESFMQNVTWLDLLKLKTSYGLNGNDDTGMPLYPYINNIQGITEVSIGNPAYDPEMVKKWNYGIELGLFNSLYLSLDIYKYHLDNMVINATALIPSYHGNVGSFPRINAGSKENSGYELEVSYIKTLSRDLSFNVGGQVSYNKNKYTKYNETIRSDDYIYPQRVEGYPVGQTWGYLVDYTNGNGLFNSEEELDEYRTRINYSFNKPRVGDIKYRDLNNDGTIDDKDQVPLAYGNIPQYTYSFFTGVTYKQFDISILFQGIERYTTSVAGSIGINEGHFTDGLFSTIHLNAWTKERYENGEKITYPALTLQSGSANTQTSEYFMVDRSYLRLKNLEIGYTLPQKLSKVINASKIRLTLSGQNLLTWDHLDGFDFGPEAGGYNSLPVFKVYNLGVSVQF